MLRLRIPTVAVAVVVGSLLLTVVGSASAQSAREQQRKSARAERDKKDVAPYLTRGSRDAARSPRALQRSAFSGPGQHGGSADHLPSARENVELVGKLELTQPFGDVVPGQIADVAVFKDFAYLNSWEEETCTRGGVFVVDISDPSNPRHAGFIPALAGNYHGEGAHAITIDTPEFKGDVLAVNNEHCADTPGGGGFDLYDVSDPRKPQVLIQGAGDRGRDNGSLTGRTGPANDYHSVFLWQDGNKAYAVGVDNFEFHDVDIFDITDPRNPRPVAEFDLFEEFAGILDNGALGNLVLHHDVVVKRIGGVQTMLSSYWDAGYVMLNVNDPANPRLIRDSTFDGPDPLFGFDPPEGNAHQAEFSFDNRFVVAADEDFNPYRTDTITVEGVGDFPAAEVGGGASPASLPDRRLNGPVVYGGYGCDASAPVPRRADFNLALARDEEAILVLQRGPTNDVDEDYNNNGNLTDDACFPGEKAANAAEAGWDAVLLVNRHPASGNAADDSAFCGSGGYPAGLAFVTLCTSHGALHRIFDDPPEFGVPYDDDVEGPAIGARGARKVSASAEFDGWGYAHVFENSGAKMRDLGAFAVEEARDPHYASGFGDLSIHEVATDPTEYLAYSAYYAAGLRVLAFGPNGIREVGRFIDEGGNNFWGIEQFTDSRGRRLMAGSDRDYGLYIARYTGPGAAVPPVCESAQVSTTRGAPVGLPLKCSDPNGNPITLQIVSGPKNGTLGPIDQAGGRVTYTPRAGFTGTDEVVFRASDPAAAGPPATVTITVLRQAADARPCERRLVGTNRSERLRGTPFGDRILGRGGNDRVDGLAWHDCLFGQSGRDRLQGGAGNDKVSGGSGNDKVYGGAGRDRVTGGSGKDRVFGVSGPDVISGGSGGDLLVGGSGRDRIFGGPGRDRVRARDRNRDVVRCGRGRDAVVADRIDRLVGCERIRD